MANILAIESTTSVCSASVLCGDKQITHFVQAEEKPSSLLIDLCHQTLEDSKVHLSDIDYIAYTKGPGAFTGVRLGLGVVQGLALACNIPTIGISTLEVLAYKFGDKSKIIIPALDARMGEIYWGVYCNNQLLEQYISKPNKVAKLQADIGIGSGWDSYKLALSNQINIKQVIDNQHPNAKYLAQLVQEKLDNQTIAPDNTITAVYLRNNVAKKSKK